MKILVSLLLVLSLACASCVSAPKPGEIYKGTYFHNFESSAFTPAGSDEPWCVSSAEMSKAIVPGSHSGTADVVLRGELSPKGNYCNLGGYKYVLKVHEVMEVSNVRSGY